MRAIVYVKVVLHGRDMLFLVERVLYTLWESTSMSQRVSQSICTQLREMTGNVFDLTNALLLNGGIDFARVDCIQAVFTKT